MRTVARCVGVPGDGQHHYVLLASPASKNPIALCGAEGMWLEDLKDAGPMVCSVCQYEARRQLCLVRQKS